MPKLIAAPTRVEAAGNKPKVIEEFERAYLSELLSTHQGNISKAARVAKKERRAFQRLLMKHGLDRRIFTAA